jgi:hypothetical protein
MYVYVTMQVSLAGDVPCGLHGGPLLGVALKRLTSSGAELSGEDASPVLQFYSWNGVTKVSQSASHGCDNMFLKEQHLASHNTTSHNC